MTDLSLFFSLPFSDTCLAFLNLVLCLTEKNYHSSTLYLFRSIHVFPIWHLSFSPFSRLFWSDLNPVDLAEPNAYRLALLQT